MTRASLPPAYFDALYADDPDPWRFATSDYERAKYDDTLAALPRGKIAAAFEVGCSIGVFTERLAPRCDRLLAVDVAPAALRTARQRCANLSNVSLAEMRVPNDWPKLDNWPGGFDLIVFSEVLYYLAPDDIVRTAELTMRTLSPAGIVLLVHWTGGTDYPCSGDEAAALFMHACEPALRQTQAVRREAYRLDRLDRA